MKLDCEIVMDLVALYHDGTASAASSAAVEEHLRTCPECRRFYRQYRAMLSQRRTAAAPEHSDDFSAVAARVRRRRSFFLGCVAVYSFSVAGVLTAMLLRNKKKG